jgi:hypothetical protein
VRSGPGAARTILLFHIISARPSKQPRMVRTFRKVHTRPKLAYLSSTSTNKQHTIGWFKKVWSVNIRSGDVYV